MTAETDVELGLQMMPRFGPDGLIPAVAQDVADGEILMLAWMNAEALRLTLKTGQAHYWSRSRKEIWLKGATSGQIQTVEELRIDCDQDAIVLKVRVGGDGCCCHVGFRSCFYRSADGPDGALVMRQPPPGS